MHVLASKRSGVLSTLRVERPSKDLTYFIALHSSNWRIDLATTVAAYTVTFYTPLLFHSILEDRLADSFENARLFRRD